MSSKPGREKVYEVTVRSLVEQTYHIKGTNPIDVKVKYEKMVLSGKAEVLGVPQGGPHIKVQFRLEDLPEGYTAKAHYPVNQYAPTFYTVLHEETGISYKDKDLHRAYEKVSSDLSRRLGRHV